MIEVLRGTIETMVRQILGPVDTYATYLATVVKQSGDYLDVEMDDKRYGPGIRRLEYRTGIPGATVTVPKGARVVVGFDEGRRSKPCVKAFVSGTPLSVTIEATAALDLKVGDTEIKATRVVDPVTGIATSKVEALAGSASIAIESSTAPGSKPTITVNADGDVDLKSTGGDVTVESTAGTVNVKADAGDIVVEPGPAGFIKLGGASAVKPVAVMGDMAGPYPVTATAIKVLA